MLVLVLNCGSSSVKYQLFETSAEMVRSGTDHAVARGIVERIGTREATHAYHIEGREGFSEPVAAPRHAQAIAEIVRTLTSAGRGVLSDVSEIDAVGHRVVHGGERFSRSAVITPEIVRQIEACSELAPLHNPHGLAGYRAIAKILPRVPHVAVFDTAFHQTMPPQAFLYGLPYDYYKRHAVRRYGFHGTSHRFVSWRSESILGRPIEATRLVTCHLGNGASVCAVERGRSVDTAMGFTPLEGLLMGTRSGDVDPAAVFHLRRKEGLDEEQASTILNTRSGLLGLSGVSNDMREILAEEARGNERARLAIEVFCYRVRKYVAAYAGAMGGADAVIFAGGIGENAPSIRERSLAGLAFMGIGVDVSRNASTIGREGEISPPGSPVRVLVIPTNEERLIARDTLHLVSGGFGS